MANIKLPEKFIEKFTQILGQNYSKFENTYLDKPQKSLWVNSNKITPENLLEKLSKNESILTQLTIHKNAFELKDLSGKPGQREEFKQGEYNLQDRAAMIPCVLLNPTKKDKVLDCCAAPGTKTLQLSNLMQNSGELTAIEINKKRFFDLKRNIEKFDIKNCNAINGDFLRLFPGRKFDKILLDAPCSGEGYSISKPETMKNWTSGLVKKRSNIQKKMIINAFDRLDKGGILVYSVCTLSPEEGENVIQRLLKKRKNVEIEKVEIKGFEYSSGLTKYNNVQFDKEIQNCVRIWPWTNNTQGFFIAKIKKR